MVRASIVNTLAETGPLIARSTPPSMDKTTTTVIIVNFNAGALLLDCVLTALSCEAVEQVIVSDNGSCDGSLRELPEHSRLSVVPNGSNLGFARANNRCLVELQTPCALLLNPDCTISNKALGEMIQFMTANQHVGMCGPLILNHDGSEQRGCRRDEPTPFASFKTLVGSRGRGINKVGDPLPDGPTEVDAISGACMLVRREALEDVGPLDEGYFLHCEDLDWCKRFWMKGWKVMFLPHVSITHAKGGSSHNRRVRVEWHKHKGMARYYRKFYADKYPRVLMYGVYTAIWTRFVLLSPVWALKSLLK